MGIGGGWVAEQESCFADVAQTVLGIAGEAAREELAVARRDAIEICPVTPRRWGRYY